MAMSPVHPDPAASVIVLRPGPRPMEVLMVERQGRGFFGSLVVFPGGGVDEADRSDLAKSVVVADADDHDHRSAALRELAEEVGWVVTLDRVLEAPGSRGAALYQALVRDDLHLAGDSLVLVSRWVTPEIAPRRFDARFYLLAVTETPPVRLDTGELVGHAWVTPEEALERHASGEWPMILPTLAHLRWLARRTSVDDAFASARGADGRTVIEPTRMEDGSLLPIHLPADS